MFCFIEVENDIELKQYPAIGKISELANRIIKNEVDHGCDSPETEISYAGKTYEINIFEFNRRKAVNLFEFFYHYLKKRDLFLFIRFTKNCLIMELHLKKNNKQTVIAGYSLKTRKKNNKDYILKSLFFDGNRLVQKQAKEFDNKNVIFIKYLDSFVLCKLNITKAYYDKLSNTNDKRNAYTFFFDIVFPNPTEVKNFMFVKTWTFASQRYPFCLKKGSTTGTDGRSRCLFIC